MTECTFLSNCCHRNLSVSVLCGPPTASRRSWPRQYWIRRTGPALHCGRLCEAFRWRRSGATSVAGSQHWTVTSAFSTRSSTTSARMWCTTCCPRSHTTTSRRPRWLSSRSWDHTTGTTSYHHPLLLCPMRCSLVIPCMCRPPQNPVQMKMPSCAGSRKPARVPSPSTWCQP